MINKEQVYDILIASGKERQYPRPIPFANHIIDNILTVYKTEDNSDWEIDINYRTNKYHFSYLFWDGKIKLLNLIY
jgi:hypothetical protein